MKKFWLGFALCYSLAGIAQGISVSKIPATTLAGAVYVGVMWLPFNLLPEDLAIQMIPSWAFKFKNKPMDEGALT